jgi:hypothetical protein
LLASTLLEFVFPEHKAGMGLNLKKLLDDPPADLLNETRLRQKGIDAKYLEPEKDKKILDVGVLINVFRLFQGPFGFAYAARLN